MQQFVTASIENENVMHVSALSGVCASISSCMRPLNWPRSLLTAQRPVPFDSWLLCRSLRCPHRSYNSAAPSVLDSQGRPVYYAPPPSYLGTDEQVPLERWLQPELVAAVKKAFQPVKYATTTQRELFHAVRQGKDVMLQTPTGSGKYVIHSAWLYHLV